MDWNVNNAFKNMKELESKAMMDMTIIAPSVEGIDLGLSSAEKVNATPSAKPRKKSMTSLYLKFFETAPDGKSRRCKFCKQSYSMATATGNLGRHLNHRHPGYDRQQGDDVTQQVSQPTVTALAIKKPQSQAKPPNVDLDHLNWLIIKWIIGGSLPLLTFEDEGLANCLKFLNPSIKLWHKDQVHTIIHEVFRSMQEDVRRDLVHVNSKISIALDFWTSYDQVCYMSITCHWIDENWDPHKVLLDVSRIPYGVLDVDNNLLKILNMFDIENKILSCTVDNSQGKLKEDLDARKLSLFFIPCAARMLNLIIDDALTMVKQMMSKIREFVLEVNASLDYSEEFRQMVAAYQDDFWKLPLDISTRWSGNYAILDLVRKAYGAIDTVVRKHDDTLGFQKILLSPAEKSVMIIMHTFLEPFYKTTTNLCTSKSPTIGLVLFFMDHITEMITACRDARGNPEWLKTGADGMAQKVGSYSSQVQNLYTYMAAVLDPRIKGELLPENLNRENNLEEARNHFLRTYGSHVPALANGMYSGPQDNDAGGGVSFAEEIARKKRRASMSGATDELTQYLAEPPASIGTDVFEWWKANSTRYPRLSVMARDYLAVQATSVAPEEVFSAKGDDVDKRRICLPHSIAQAVLCIRSWMQSGFKLKYRSTEIDCEKLLQSAAAVSDKH